MIEAVYEDGPYGQQIDYRQPPSPPLAEDDAAWSDDLLHKPGRR